MVPLNGIVLNQDIMKKQFIVSVIGLVVLLVSFGNIQAQNGYKMSVEDRVLHGEKGPAYVLEIDRAIEKDVMVAWEKMLEKNKFKATVQKNLLQVENVVITSLGEDSVSLYSEVVQQDTSVRLYTIFYVDSGKVDPNGKEGLSIKVRKMIEGFGMEVYRNVLTRELEEKNEALEDLIKKRENNLKEQDKVEIAIESDSLEIKDTEKKIQHFNSELNVAEKKYIDQKNLISTTKFQNPDMAKEAKATLKKFDKDRKGLKKEIEKSTKDLIGIKNGVRDKWYNLKQLESDLERNEGLLETQRKIVKDSQLELNSY